MRVGGRLLVSGLLALLLTASAEAACTTVAKHLTGNVSPSLDGVARLTAGSTQISAYNTGNQVYFNASGSPELSIDSAKNAFLLFDSAPGGSSKWGCWDTGNVVQFSISVSTGQGTYTATSSVTFDLNVNGTQAIPNSTLQPPPAPTPTPTPTPTPNATATPSPTPNATATPSPAPTPAPAPAAPAAAGGAGGGGGGGAAAPEAAAPPPPPPAPVVAAERVDLPPAKAGESATVALPTTPVQEIAVEAARNIREPVRVTAQHFSSQPSSVSSSPSGRAYAFLSIEAPGLDPGDVAKATLKTKVERVWLTANKIAQETVKVQRYTTTWTPLPTKVDSQDAEFLYLKAESPGFSFFAITGEEGSAVRPGLAPAAPSATPAPSAVYLPPVGGPVSTTAPARSPGFEAVLAGLSLGAALLLHRKPRR